MKLIFIIIFLNFINGAFGSEIHEPLKIHLFCSANGKGLERDRDILLEALSNLNCVVEWYNGTGTKEISFADINIFVEQIDKKQLHSAKENWFIPNPEWYLQKRHLLNNMNLILCRTKEIERIFTDLGKDCFFLGFTSRDRYLKKIRRSPSQYLHVAGSSSQKGSEVVKAAWLKNKNFPHVTILKRPMHSLSLRNLKIINTFIEEKKLLKLQNQCMVHIAVSETEGFGHSLMEAMSVGAVVITTDAPPMNEFINEKCCLVPYERQAPQHLGINYYVNPKALAITINEIRKIPKIELKKIGEMNRQRYLQMTKEFKTNLKNLISSRQLLKEDLPKDEEDDEVVFSQNGF